MEKKSIRPMKNFWGSKFILLLRYGSVAEICCLPLLIFVVSYYSFFSFPEIQKVFEADPFSALPRVHLPQWVQAKPDPITFRDEC
jgi:hypothetical protein